MWTAIISIFLISILTNYLPLETYGLYSKIYNYVGIFVFLADLGLYTITIREISDNQKDSKKIVGNMLTLRVLLWILMLFVGVGIAFFIPGYNTDIALLAIIITSFFTIFQLINSSLLALMQANLKMEFSLLSTIIWKLSNLLFIIAIVFVWFQKDSIENYNTAFLYIMFAWVFWIIVNTLMNYWYANKIVPIRFLYDGEYIKKILKISIPYGIALFLSVVYFKVDIIILSIIEWPKLWDISIALYALPMKIVEVIMMLGGFYLNSILPGLTKDFSEKNSSQITKNIFIYFQILFSSALFIFVLGFLFRDYLIEIIANKSYLIPDHLYNSSDAFVIVFVLIIFHFLSLIFTYLLIASHNQSRLLKINIYITIFNIVGNIVMIPYFSFIWAWIVTLISQILLLILWYFYTKDIIKLPFKNIMSYWYKSLLLAGSVFILGIFMLSKFSFNLYGDLLIFGSILSIIFCTWYYLIFKVSRRL